ncbi:MAG: SgcJ/EcaC family oxidoreductase [Ginsengibacter sp.]
MKKVLITCFLLVSTCTLFAQNNTPSEKAIKTIIQKQEDAWNRHDINGMGAYFTGDATLINFLGMFWKSKAEIIENLGRINEAVFKHTSIKFELKKLKFITNEVAIANIEEQFNVKEDYTDVGQQYKKGDKNYKLITNVFVRKNNEWLVTASQLTLINQFVSPHKE